MGAGVRGGNDAAHSSVDPVTMESGVDRPTTEERCTQDRGAKQKEETRAQGEGLRGETDYDDDKEEAAESEEAPAADLFPAAAKGQKVRKLAQACSTCDFCSKPIPDVKMEQHAKFCGPRRLKSKYGRTWWLLQEQTCLRLLSKVAGAPVTTETILLDGAAVRMLREHPIPFKPPPALDSKVTAAMLAAGEAAGCRREDRKEKHFAQEAALCSVISGMIQEIDPSIHSAGLASGDARDSVCLIDIGAAAGELLHLFQSVFRTTVVLVEFYEPPRTVDALYADDPDSFGRIWKKVGSVTKEDLLRYKRKVNIVVGKHLCGDGTCSTISCVVGAWREFFPVSGVLVSPCCQQMSTWDGYCGSGHLARAFGVCPEDFEAIRKKTGWKSLSHRDDTWHRRHLYDVAKLFESLWHHGRVNFLLASGATRVEAFQFIEEDVTIKNVCISAIFSTPR
ncbi:hypothetical protein DIPPA_09251 [Diplonema papillatum]|nr:hypothetical protein DIPPA_09251 [Diplonema papillatum]